MNRVRSDVTWSVAGQIFQTATSWLVVMVLARVQPDGALVGHYALAAALCSPLFMFASLQLRSVVVSDASEEFPFSTYLGLRSLCLVLAFAAAVCLAFSRLSKGTLPSLVIAVSLVRCVDLVSDLFQGYLQRFGAIPRMTQVASVRVMVTTSLFFAAYWGGGSLATAVFASALGGAVCVAFVDLPVARRLARSRLGAVAGSTTWAKFTPGLRDKSLGRLVRRVLPLGITALLGSLFLQFPLYVLGRKLGKEDVGRFAVVYNPSVVVQVLMVGALEGLLARFADAATRRDWILYRHLLGRALALALILGVGLVLGAYVFGPAALRIAYGPSYEDQAYVLFVLCVAASVGFIATVMGYCLISVRSFRAVFLSSLVGFPISVLLMVTLVDAYGALGAAWAVACTNAAAILINSSAFLLSLRHANRKTIPAGTA